MNNHKNPFKQKNKINIKQKAETWGKVKFNPVEHIRAEPATPWNQFKDEMIQREQEEKNSKAVDVNSKEAQEHFKQREKNYRKMMIEEARKQPTKWEDFAAESDGEPKAKQTKVFEKLKDHKNKRKKSNEFGNFERKREEKKPWKNHKTELQIKEQSNNPFRKAKSTQIDTHTDALKSKGKGIFRDFDPKNITMEQNIALTKQITKEVTKKKCDFYSMVHDLKRYGLKPPKRKYPAQE